MVTDCLNTLTDIINSVLQGEGAVTFGIDIRRSLTLEVD